MLGECDVDYLSLHPSLSFGQSINVVIVDNYISRALLATPMFSVECFPDRCAFPDSSVTHDVFRRLTT